MRLGATLSDPGARWGLNAASMYTTLPDWAWARRINITTEGSPDAVSLAGLPSGAAVDDAMVMLCWNVSATLRNAGQSGSLSLRLLLAPTYISLGLIPLWVEWKKGYCNWQWRKFQYNIVHECFIGE